MSLGDAKTAKSFIDKHYEYHDKLIQLEEEKSLKTLTEQHNFELELDLDKITRSDRETVINNSKVA
jgi:hypothetical protein